MTPEIQFYHLLSTPLDRALPKLMEKAIQSGQRVIVQCADAQQIALLDDALWTYDSQRFLPHGRADGPHADDQPICLTLDQQAPNQATIAVITNGSTLMLPSPYTKVLDLFDGHDSQSVESARARWKHYQQAGLTLSYIQQQKGGGWKIMAKTGD